MKKPVKSFAKAIGLIVLAFIAYIVYINFFIRVDYDHLALSDLQGTEVNLEDHFRDHFVLINFWATWCKPCLEEMPMLDSVYRDLDKETWQFLLVSEEPLEKIEKFKTQSGFMMPFLGSTKSLDDVGVYALPKTIVIHQKENSCIQRAELLLPLPVN